MDNLEPYEVIEFTNKNDDYLKKLELSNNNEKYFILVDAITYDRELLSYDSIVVDIEKGKDDGSAKSDDVEKEKNGELPVWVLILIISILALLLIAIIFTIIRCILRKKGNVIEDYNKKMIPSNQ